MNITISKTGRAARVALIDVALVAVMCAVPALSHVLAFPLYKLNPMLGVMLAGMMLVKDRRNALLMAVVLPLVSMLVTGMLAFPKMVCMAAELLTVSAVFGVASGRMKCFPAVLLSIVAGRGVYYMAKALLISPVALVGTEWWIQVVTSLAWAAVFAAWYKSQWGA